jgi:long-chain fatty acid transport protein
MLEAIPNHLWLAASYQAQPGLGSMTLKGSLDVTYRDSLLPLQITFDQALPDILRLGARFRPNDSLELRIAGDFTRWSVMGSQCVVIEGHKCAVDSTGADASGENGTVQQNLRRHWNDTYGVRAGASLWLKPEVELFAGVGIETAAVPDETLDPSLADAVNISPALGGRFEIWRAMYLAASYTHIQYLNRDNTGKSTNADAELPTRRPDGGGKYTQWIGVFNVNVEKQF